MLRPLFQFNISDATRDYDDRMPLATRRSATKLKPEESLKTSKSVRKSFSRPELVIDGLVRQVEQSTIQDAKPKFFPLFYKRAAKASDATTTDDDRSEATRGTASSSVAGESEDVSSPPPGELNLL